MTAKHGKGTFSENIGVREAWTTRNRTNFAASYLAAAGHFAALCRDIETSQAGVVFDKLPQGESAKLVYYCVAAVMLAVSALDAYAKEAFYDKKNKLRGVTDDQRKQAVTNAKKRIKDKLGYASSILANYEAIRTLSGLPALDLDAPDVKDVCLLIFTRDGLVHVEPEWRDEKKTHARIGKALQKVGFSPNPFLPPESVFFPERCMGYGLAEWATRKATDFANTFRPVVGDDGVFGPYV